MRSHEPGVKPSQEMPVLWGQSPSPSRIILSQCSLKCLLSKLSLQLGKTLEEGSWSPGLGEGWQLRGVTDQPAILTVKTGTTHSEEQELKAKWTGVRLFFPL